MKVIFTKLSLFGINELPLCRINLGINHIKVESKLLILSEKVFDIFIRATGSVWKVYIISSTLFHRYSCEFEYIRLFSALEINVQPFGRTEPSVCPKLARLGIEIYLIVLPLIIVARSKRNCFRADLLWIFSNIVVHKHLHHEVEISCCLIQIDSVHSHHEIKFGLWIHYHRYLVGYVPL